MNKSMLKKSVVTTAIIFLSVAVITNVQAQEEINIIDQFLQNIEKQIKNGTEEFKTNLINEEIKNLTEFIDIRESVLID